MRMVSNALKLSPHSWWSWILWVWNSKTARTASLCPTVSGPLLGDPEASIIARCTSSPAGLCLGQQAWPTGKGSPSCPLLVGSLCLPYPVGGFQEHFQPLPSRKGLRVRPYLAQRVPWWSLAGNGLGGWVQLHFLWGTSEPLTSVLLRPQYLAPFLRHMHIHATLFWVCVSILHVFLSEGQSSLAIFSSFDYKSNLIKNKSSLLQCRAGERMALWRKPEKYPQGLIKSVVWMHAQSEELEDSVVLYCHNSFVKYIGKGYN